MNLRFITNSQKKVLLNIVLGLFVFLQSVCLSGCLMNDPVREVTKEPIAVKKRYIEDLKPGEENPIGEHEEALTDWQFGCKTDLSFEVLEKNNLADDFMVTVKLKSVAMRLEAPITVWLSKKSKQEVVDHEMAHVAICKRAYEKASEIAMASIEKAMKRTYQASGKTLKVAIKNALSIANQEICQYYHLNMVEKVNRVSEIFDSIEHNLDKPMDEVVDMAFEKYAVVAPKEKPPKQEGSLKGDN